MEEQGESRLGTPFRYDRSAPKNAEARPIGRVPEAVGLEGKLVENLHLELAALETRLSPVLHGSSPAGAAGRLDPRVDKRPEASGVAMQLEMLNDKLEEAIDLVRTLNARLDL